jgi:UDP-N-acetylglucosamine 2-epimerase (non-hydrolysing)
MQKLIYLIVGSRPNFIIDEGTNVLVGTEPVNILREASNVLDGGGKNGTRPDLWDGQAAERIVEQLGVLI